MNNKRVAVIGASAKPHRYSYQAVMLLKEKGYEVFPVHKRLKEIEGIPVFSSILEVPGPVDTVTLYVNADISSSMKEDFLKKRPRRIIFNPGAENPDLKSAAEASGIITVEGCTLVMLKTGQF